MSLPQRLREFAIRLGSQEYALVLLILLGIKALMYGLSVSAQGVHVLSWQAVELLPTLWNRWDAGWYIQIAEQGYTTAGESHRSIAFYPLYPWLIRLMHVVIPDYPLAALVVSNIVAIVGGVMLYRLARLEFGAFVSRWSLLACLFFPSAYFFHASYTEGLFLLLSVAAFYAARSSRWVLAGVLGGAAALTRTPGLLLLPALLVEWFCQHRERPKGWTSALWLALIPAGWGIYLLINLQIYGSPLAFVQAQHVHWHVSLSWPWLSIEKALLRGRLLSQFVGLNEGFIHAWAHVGAVTLLLIGCLWSAVRLRYSYTVFLLLVTIQVTSLNFLLSTPRLMLSGFPVFFMLGHLAQSRILRLVWFASTLPLLWLLLQRFVLGQWAF